MVSLIRVLVVDDHALVRHAVTDLLAGTGDIAVVGLCADGREVVTAVERLKPDIVLLDVEMPHMDGLAAARVLRSTHLEVRVIFLTVGHISGCATEAWNTGAAGFLVKGDHPEALAGHIRTVAAGGTAWPRAVAELETQAFRPEG
jgi:DNA-binding NarL/FixJ family response regulator